MDYLDRPVLDWRPDFGPGIEHGQLDDHAYESQSGGVAVPWKATTGPKRVLRLPFIFGSMEETKEFRAFVAGRDGRRQGFWVPTWLTDFEPTANVNASVDEIAIRAVGLNTKLGFSEQFKHIALITRDKLEIYEIEDSESDGEVETLSLDRGLDTDLVASKTVVCGVIFARFADDQVDFSYRSKGVVRCETNIVELPAETDTEHTGSQPLFLYRFTRGATVVRVTNWPIDVTAGELVWNAMDIEHGELSEDAEFNLEPLTVTVVTDDAESFFRVLLDRHLSELTTVEIFKSDYSTLAVNFDEPIYKGEVVSPEFGEKGMITLMLTSVFRIGERQTPRYILQRTCNHRLFSTRCGLSEAAFITTGEITAISADPPYIEAAEFAAKALAESDPNWFALGKVTVGTETRFCVGADEERLYLNARFRLAEVGHEASARPGCDKRAGTCDAKFDNIENHFGFGLIPNRNPQFEQLQTPKPAGGKK